MKKLIIKASFLVLSLTVAVGCKKDIDDKFNNPENVLDPNLPGLFTGMLNNDRVAAKYWNVRTFLSQMPGVYAQTTYIANGNTVYQQSDSYSQQYWDDFYSPGGNGSGTVALYRAMEKKFNTLSSTDQAVQRVILQAAKVVMIEQAAKMVDLWGDIPYSEAGSLTATNVIKNPKYDEQKALYTSFISDLASAATFFKAASTTAAFSKADILLQGNVKKWESYANSLRLRLLMRISKTDEANAKTAVLQMLGDQTNFPLIDGGIDITKYNPATMDVLLQPLTNSSSDLHDAFFEGSWYATDYMLNTVLLPANDPRIPVLYDKFGRVKKVAGKDQFVQNPTYKAMPITFTTAEQETNFADYSVLDSGTFVFNQKLPGILITASEVNLLKAEAFERWGSTTNAKTAYDMALRQSVAFYYHLNNINQGAYVKETFPLATTIDTWVNTSTAAYTGATTDKLTKIYTQKWVHFGVLQSTEAWSEYRRTGFPVLTFPTNGKQAGYETPPTRLIYPAKEKTLNSANYQAVLAKDTRKTKIFWMP